MLSNPILSNPIFELPLISILKEPSYAVVVQLSFCASLFSSLTTTYARGWPLVSITRPVKVCEKRLDISIVDIWSITVKIPSLYYGFDFIYGQAIPATQSTTVQYKRLLTNDVSIKNITYWRSSESISYQDTRDIIH